MDDAEATGVGACVGINLCGLETTYFFHSTVTRQTAPVETMV
ncbi:hypothetical protein EYZ11_001352 [Aspergillus tanneri]|uniref:Uncharacterized protein n=1 Tax=Aspergillus tanneri TaxID=1220188 RepID=A0A4S3JUW1_9EURO|nr:hypothetical protein EYZ11_001352 [Aspergillus tanneri]